MKRTFIGTRKRTTGRERKTERKPIDSAENITLEQALTLFVRAKEAERVRPATVKNYIDHVHYLTEYLSGFKSMSNPCVGEISSELIRDYINYMLYEHTRYRNVDGRLDKTIGLSPHTVNIRLRTLRTMSKFWEIEGVIKGDFMANVKSVTIDEEDEVQGLTETELDLVLSSYDSSQYADYRDLVLIYLLLDTGLRIGEAVGLTLDRMEFNLLTVYVPSQIAKNRRNREIPISYEVAKKLRELYEESSSYFGESDRIFFNAYGEPYSADAFRKRLNRRKKRLGLDRLSPHMFRHTFGRNYLLNGGDIETLRRILDHADIETTRKYAVVDNTDIKNQHNKYSPIKRILKRRK